ncbi:MAG: DUF512 domain-containing protein, partial [Desulfocucumaceae bacterium]
SGKYALEPVIKDLNKIKNCRITLRAVANSYFGPTVTVTGLLTGECLLAGLSDIPPGSRIIIPDVMLKGPEKCFLDGLTVEEVSRRLGVEIVPVPTGPQGLVDKILMK